MNIVAVGAGSNINPEINIQSACEILAKEQTLLKTSGIIKTRPIGFMEQDDFLNCVFLVSTKMEKESFGLYLKEIESRLNRERTVNKYGPRTIDLDIVVWNGMIADKDFHTRDFLRDGVLEVLPGADAE